MNNIKNNLNRILEPFLLGLLVTLVLVVLWQVFSRYVLQSPSTFTDEVARFLLIWLSLIGAAWVLGQKAHLAIDILPENLARKGDTRLYRFLYVLILVFALSVMVVGGFNLVQVTLKLEQLSTVLQVPMGYIYLALPISGLLITIYSICHIFSDNIASKEDQ